MKPSVLLVSASVETFQVVGKCLEDLGRDLDQQLYYDWAKHAREAEDRLGGTLYRLVISEVDIPENRTSILQPNQPAGLRLLEAIRKQNKSIPWILLGTGYEPTVHNALAKIPEAEFVSRGEPDWDESLTKYCRQFLRAEPRSPKPLRLDVEISLHPAHDRRWRLNLVGSPAPPQTGPLGLDEKEAANLIDLSADLDKARNWQDRLRRIGEKLYQQIFVSNFDFAMAFSNCCGMLDDQDKVSIRFVVARDMHPIFLEAIKKAGDEERYWMLKEPIFREVAERTNRWALYEEEETRANPVNCLIIEANLNPDGKQVFPKLCLELHYLEHVPTEVKWLLDYLKKLQDTSCPSVGNCLVVHGTDELKSALKKETWHLVHYAGHSYYHDDTKAGYIFVPSRQGAPLQDISAIEFARMTGECGAQFVFLSSCHSSEEDFVFELANAHVPAIVGFRGDLPDKLAETFMQRFYEHLFGTRSLQYAFLEARKDMHNNNETRLTQIWAAPLLVIQSKKEP